MSFVIMYTGFTEMSVKTDLECLIECLKYRQDDTDRAKDTILTIASLTASSCEDGMIIKLSFID